MDWFVQRLQDVFRTSALRKPIRLSGDDYFRRFVSTLIASWGVEVVEGDSTSHQKPQPTNLHLPTFIERSADAELLIVFLIKKIVSQNESSQSGLWRAPDRIELALLLFLCCYPWRNLSQLDSFLSSAIDNADSSTIRFHNSIACSHNLFDEQAIGQDYVDGKLAAILETFIKASATQSRVVIHYVNVSNLRDGQYFSSVRLNQVWQAYQNIAALEREYDLNPMVEKCLRLRAVGLAEDKIAVNLDLESEQYCSWCKKNNINLEFDEEDHVYKDWVLAAMGLHVLGHLKLSSCKADFSEFQVGEMIIQPTDKQRIIFQIIHDSGSRGVNTTRILSDKQLDDYVLRSWAEAFDVSEYKKLLKNYIIKRNSRLFLSSDLNIRPETP